MKRALSLALVLLAFAACERVTEPVSSPMAVPPPLFSNGAGTCGLERQITADPADQWEPAISGDRIVWVDYRSGSEEIYLFDLATGTEQRVATPVTEAGFQLHLAISGDRIVWEDHRNGNADIYLFDLASETEQQITHLGGQIEPAISGDRIVWEELRGNNRDIYLFDLATGTEQRITTDPGAQRDPAISGDRIVWVDYRNPRADGSVQGDIYLFDRATGTERAITADEVDQIIPAISGDRVVWLDRRNANANIYLFDLGTETEQKVSPGVAHQVAPAISGDRIVWADWRNGSADIYLSDLATGTERQIGTGLSASSPQLAISGDRIVWMDIRNGHDISLFDLSADLTPPTITPPPDVSAGNDPGLASATVNPGTATAADDCSDVVVLGSRSDGLALGDPYPVGVTTITWTATDGKGNSSSAEQHVTVVDVEAPNVSVPDDFAADATSPSGAEVLYTATATDNVGVATFACTPVSGTLLAIGTHTVTCSAADGAGNSESASFLVTVNGAEEQVTDLEDTVTDLGLPEGTEASLQQQLDGAQAAIAGGQPGTACNQLRAFINHVNAQIGKKITAEEAAILIAEAERIRAVLGC